MEKSLLYTKRAGSGIPLVLIHGFCENQSIWWPTLQAFPGHHILLVDLPGFGGSASDELVRYSIKDMAQALARILQAESISSCILIGHSMGGYVALALAEQYPQVVQGLGLIHSHPFSDTPEKKKNRTKSINFVKKVGALPYAQQLIPSLFTDEWRANHDLAVQSMIWQASQAGVPGIVNALDVMKTREDRSKLVETVDFPFLFVLGLKDPFIPPNLNLQQCHLAKCSDVHILPDMAHMVMMENPDKWFEILDHFIRFC